MQKPKPAPPAQDAALERGVLEVINTKKKQSKPSSLKEIFEALVKRPQNKDVSPVEVRRAVWRLIADDKAHFDEDLSLRPVVHRD